MKQTHLWKVKDEYDIACGSCGGILYGYDEEICPCCGAFIDMDDEREITSEGLIAWAEAYNG